MTEWHDQPPGWAVATVGELLARIETGKSPRCDPRPASSSETGVIKVSAMTYGEFNAQENKALLPGAGFDPEHEIGGGDLLFSRANTAAYVGAVVRVPDNVRRGLLLSDKSLRLVPVPGVHPKWLMFALRSEGVRRQIEVGATGTKDSMRNVSQEKVRALVVAVPPAEEQSRIVSALEEQLDDLDVVVSSIHGTVAKLEALRRAVLRAAAAGDLLDIPAGDPEALLKAVRASRGDVVRNKVVAPHNAPSKTPPGWARVSLDSLVAIPRRMAYGVLQPGADVPGGVPFVRVGDIAGGVVATAGLKHIAPDIAERYPRTRLQGGELLITLVGTIGRVGVAPQALAGANVARAVGVIPLVPEVNAQFVALTLQAEPYTSAVVGRAHEVARKTLNLEDVRALPIPLPDRRTQDRIVAEVERHLTTITAASAGLATIRRRCRALQSSVLSAAVTGRLVEQDPSDEPAELLLKRIAEDRAMTAPTAPRRRAHTVPTTRTRAAAKPVEESA